MIGAEIFQDSGAKIIVHHIKKLYQFIKDFFGPIIPRLQGGAPCVPVGHPGIGALAPYKYTGGCYGSDSPVRVLDLNEFRLQVRQKEAPPAMFGRLR
jgi:hypothetical protein